jgi:hypothetical protein
MGADVDVMQAGISIAVIDLWDVDIAEASGR